MRIPLQRLCVFLCLFLAVSCSIQKRVYLPGYHIEWKKSPKTAPDPGEHRFTGYSLEAYNALSTKPSEESLLNVANPEPIYCREGTVIEFPSNAFMYENGDVIRCTQVAVFVTEFYSKSDILASGLTTSDHGRMLVSAGMVYIEVRCHGEKLKLRPGKRVAIRMPAAEKEPGMKAFAGKLNQGIIDWKVEGKLVTNEPEPAESDPEGMGRNPENMGGPEGYEGSGEAGYQLKMTSLGWINCDRFYDAKTTTKLVVKADQTLKTFVVLVFRDIKSVMPGSQFSDQVTEFNGVPVGSEATVLAYRLNEKAGTALVGLQDVVVGDTAVVRVSMEHMAMGEFKSMLKQFDQ